MDTRNRINGLKLGCAVAALLAGALPASAWAQAADPAAAPAPAQDQPPAQDEEMEQADEIVVEGQLRGAVQGDIKPELQLSPADIRAYGVSSLADLLNELAPQTRSDRGRGGGGPVILLNGRRISGFSELRDLPPEAIERVDILPEEAALKFGYRADQRVVNIVLRQRFRSITSEVSLGGPTAGGFTTQRGQVGVVRINRNGRVNVDMQYNGSGRLTEDERDIDSPIASRLIDAEGNVVDVRPYRTLVSPTDTLAINSVVSRNLSAKVSASVNARLEATTTQSWLGLGGVDLAVPGSNPFSATGQDELVPRYIDGSGPLTRTVQGRTAHAGFSVSGDALPWRWSVTGNYDRVTSSAITDGGFTGAAFQSRVTASDPTANPFGIIPIDQVGILPAQIAKSTSSVASIDGLVTGPLAKLPAGELRTSLRLTGETNDFASESFRLGVPRSGDVSRDRGSAQLNVDLPITSRRRGVLDAIGDLSLNANVEVEQLSDFGTLVTTGYGAVWSPIPQIRLIGSVTDEEGAPTAQQLGNPVLITPNVRIFDYVRGESVDINTITGGNPGLTADSRNVMKIGANVTPFSKLQFNLSADYIRSTTRNQITAFPAATAEIEAAFPDRFVRDGDGQLLSIDTRPVNFARAERSELRWGFNLSVPLGSTIEKRIRERRAEYERQREEAERNGTPPPPPPEGMFGRRGDGQGRPPGEGGQAGAGGPPGGEGGPRQFGGPGGGGGGGFRGFGGRGGMGGRAQFSLYHTVRFIDRIEIRPGLPVLDLLDGSATGNSGGNSRHQIEAQAGYSKDGYGLRLVGNWQSGTSVASGALGSGDRLDFSSLGTLGVRAFIDMGQQLRLVRDHRWLRGMRITLGVENLFDARQRVTDQNGVVPLNYQPDLLNPTGRTVRLSVRKLFF